MTKDIRTERVQVTTLAMPLLRDRIFWGVLFWEVEQKSSLNETVIPTKFFEDKTPFL